MEHYIDSGEPFSDIAVRVISRLPLSKRIKRLERLEMSVRAKPLHVALAVPQHREEPSHLQRTYEGGASASRTRGACTVTVPDPTATLRGLSFPLR